MLMTDYEIRKAVLSYLSEYMEEQQEQQTEVSEYVEEKCTMCDGVGYTWGCVGSRPCFKCDREGVIIKRNNKLKRK